MLEYDWEHSVGHWVCSTFHAMRRSLSACLAQEDMTFRQWEVLAWLSVNQTLSQAALADLMSIEAHTLAGVLGRMERDGWIERRPCPNDRRKNTLHPTPQSESVWTRAVDCCHQVRAAAVVGISPEELATFKRICEKIRHNLSQDGDLGPIDPCQAEIGESSAAVDEPPLDDAEYDLTVNADATAASAPTFAPERFGAGGVPVTARRN